MCRSIKRMISLLLVLMLLFSLAPAVFAVGTDIQEEPAEPAVTTEQTSEKSTPESTESTEATPQPTEEPVDSSFSESNSQTETTEEENETEEFLTAPMLTPQQILVEEREPAEEATNEEIMLLSETTGNLMFFNLSKPDYTVRMGTQVAVTYAVNGNGAVQTAYVKNLGWHYASPNKNHTLYCIEPYKNFGESTSYNAQDAGVTLTGSAGTHGEEVWYSMPLERRQAIALILLYSNERWDHSVDVATTAKDDNPNVSLRVATQFLIYEIVTGLRDASTFNRLASNGYTSGDVFYNAGVNNVWNFAYHYDAIERSIKEHMKIPSFTSKTSSSAPTITLTGNSTTVTDSNGVLSKFTFTNGNGATFSKSGNTLTISPTGTISDSTVFSCSRNLFSPEASTYSLWYSPYISSYQTCISLHGEVTGEMKAYFKIKAETKGAIEIIKNTNTGAGLSGWKFDVYKDSACTQLYGTYTSGADGKVKINDVPIGTYYIREQGNSDSYWVCDTTTKTVSVASNQTVSATFTNTHKGKGTFRKTTNTGENLKAWMITVYRDADCSDPIETLTTAADGTVSMMLEPGTYYAAETDDAYGRFADEYWVMDNTVQEFEIKAGENTTVTFANTHYGKAKIVKTFATDGSVAGWKFRVTEPNGTEVDGSPFTTDENGIITTGKLLPGTYTVEELIPENSLYYCKSENPQTITVKQGETASVSFTNALRPGEIIVEKVNATGEHLKYATFMLEWSTDGTNWTPVHYSDKENVVMGGCSNPNVVNGCLTTDDTGILKWSNLYPGMQYRVTEVEAPDGYSMLTEPAFEGMLPTDTLKTELRVVNCEVFTLPQTGSMSAVMLTMGQALSATISVGLWMKLKRKDE